MVEKVSQKLSDENMGAVREIKGREGRRGKHEAARDIISQILFRCRDFPSLYLIHACHAMLSSEVAKYRVWGSHQESHLGRYKSHEGIERVLVALNFIPDLTLFLKKGFEVQSLSF